MIIGVPSGIGDVSWMYSKLMHTGPLDLEVADGWPYRTVPFLELLPGIRDSSYGDFQYQDILSFESVQGINGKTEWADLKDKGYGRLLLEANRHLEVGRQLEDWLPDLPCTYHYEIITKPGDDEKANTILAGLRRPIVGISAASYRGSEAWKTWGYGEWSDYLKRLQAEAGCSILLIGGFWDDLTSMLSEEGYKDCVGRTNVGTMVELLKRIDGYIGFSSGLGVLRTVLNKPALMFWPAHQKELSTSWAPPHMLASGSYTAIPWLEPAMAMKATKKWLRQLS